MRRYVVIEKQASPEEAAGCFGCLILIILQSLFMSFLVSFLKQVDKFIIDPSIYPPPYRQVGLFYYFTIITLPSTLLKNVSAGITSFIAFFLDLTPFSNLNIILTAVFLLLSLIVVSRIIRLLYRKIRSRLPLRKISGIFFALYLAPLFCSIAWFLMSSLFSWVFDTKPSS